MARQRSHSIEFKRWVAQEFDPNIVIFQFCTDEEMADERSNVQSSI